MRPEPIIRKILCLSAVCVIGLLAIAADPDETGNQSRTASGSVTDQEAQINNELAATPESSVSDLAVEMEESEPVESLDAESVFTNPIEIIDGREHTLGEDGLYYPLDIGEERTGWDLGKIHPL